MANRDLYDIHTLYAEVNRRAADVNATVSIDPNAHTASTDGRVVTVPAIKDPVSDDALTLLRYQVIHECGHLARRDFFDLLRTEKVDMRTKLGTILNIVEDEVQERLVQAKAPGDAKAMGEGRAILYSRSLENWRKFCKDNDLANMSDESVKFSAAYYLAAATRDWDRWSVLQREAMIRNGPPESVRIFKELLDEGWCERIVKGGGPKKVLKLARDLFKRLFPEDDPNEQPPPPPEGGEAAPQSGVIPWEEFLSSVHDATSAAVDKQAPGAAIDWRGFGGQGDAAVPMEHHEIVTSRELDSKGWTQSGVQPYAPGSASALAERTRILLQSLTRSRWLYGTTSGRLNRRALSRLALPIVPGSDSYRKVFKRRRLGLELDCAVTVLMDVSGSMNGQKMNVAGQCLMRLYHVLARALRIPLELACFSATGSVARTKIVKSFADRTVPIEQVYLRVNAAVNLSKGGNADGDAVLLAIGRLLKVQASRRVMIVLSDGAPSASHMQTDPGTMLHAALRACRNRGIEVYGIGIQTDCVTAFYGDQCRHVMDVAELDEALIATLKGVLIGEQRA